MKDEEDSMSSKVRVCVVILVVVKYDDIK